MNISGFSKNIATLLSQLVSIAHMQFPINSLQCLIIIIIAGVR